MRRSSEEYETFIVVNYHSPVSDTIRNMERCCRDEEEETMKKTEN